MAFSHSFGLEKGWRVRFCVEFCKLNQVARFDAYPMPLIEEVFESVGSATVLTTLDLACGYWQIPMASEPRDKTAFTTLFGLFELEVMPFGLHSAPATFQRMINYVLPDWEQFSCAYLDDVVIFSRTWRSIVLTSDRFLASGGNWTDRQVSQVPLWGNKGSTPGPCGWSLQPEEEHPQPVTKTDVWAFLGLVGYYRRFMVNFASVAAHLTDLTRKGQAHQVDREMSRRSHSSSLNTLSRALQSYG